MTPKEKAIELFDKMIFNQAISIKLDYPHLANEYAKDCALIAVDEIIKNMPKGFYSGLRPYYKGSDLEYWQEVKQEILAV